MGGFLFILHGLRRDNGLTVKVIRSRRAGGDLQVVTIFI